MRDPSLLRPLHDANDPRFPRETLRYFRLEGIDPPPRDVIVPPSARSRIRRVFERLLRFACIG